jgi:hypothetical protein
VIPPPRGSAEGALDGVTERGLGAFEDRPEERVPQTEGLEIERESRRAQTAVAPPVPETASASRGSGTASSNRLMLQENAVTNRCGLLPSAASFV